MNHKNEAKKLADLALFLTCDELNYIKIEIEAMEFREKKCVIEFLECLKRAKDCNNPRLTKEHSPPRTMRPR
jgi:hypothetical protein